LTEFVDVVHGSMFVTVCVGHELAITEQWIRHQGSLTEIMHKALKANFRIVQVVQNASRFKEHGSDFSCPATHIAHTQDFLRAPRAAPPNLVGMLCP